VETLLGEQGAHPPRMSHGCWKKPPAHRNPLREVTLRRQMAETRGSLGTLNAARTGA
jgi:hypothetical protein